MKTASNAGIIIAAALLACSCSRTEEENQCSGV
jgi:hypothetical protein